MSTGRSGTLEDEAKLAPGTKRVNVNFSQEAYQTLADLAAAKNLPMSEILRQAISLTKFVEDVVAKNGRILVDRDGKISEILLR